MADNSNAMVPATSQPSYDELMAMYNAAQSSAITATNELKRTRAKAEIDEAATRDPKVPPVPWLVPKSIRRGTEWLEMDLPKYCQQKQTQLQTQPGAWLQNCVRTRDKTCNQSFTDPSKDNGFFPYSADLKARIKEVLTRGIQLRTFGDMCGVPPVPGYVHRHHFPGTVLCGFCKKQLSVTADARPFTHPNQVGYHPEQMEPCPRCLLRFYCGKSCRSSDWFSNHQYECAKHPLFRHREDEGFTLATGWEVDPFCAKTAPQVEPKFEARKR